MSSGERRPRAKAATAGATPNEIRSARLSSSWPRALPAPLPRMRATFPSITSARKPRGMNARASQIVDDGEGE